MFPGTKGQYHLVTMSELGIHKARWRNASQLQEIASWAIFQCITIFYFPSCCQNKLTESTDFPCWEDLNCKGSLGSESGEIFSLSPSQAEQINGKNLRWRRIFHSSQLKVYWSQLCNKLNWCLGQILQESWGGMQFWERGAARPRVREWGWGHMPSESQGSRS